MRLVAGRRVGAGAVLVEQRQAGPKKLDDVHLVLGLGKQPQRLRPAAGEHLVPELRPARRSGGARLRCRTRQARADARPTSKGGFRRWPRTMSGGRRSWCSRCSGRCPSSCWGRSGPTGTGSSPNTALSGDIGGLPDEWTPGSLPPEVAACSLLTSAALLAAEGGTPLAGISWNPDPLHAGERAAICAETLLRHLDAADAALMPRLFTAPVTRPMLLLLKALRADRRGLNAGREGVRRRQAVCGVYRAECCKARRELHETEAERESRRRWALAKHPPGCFTLAHVLRENVPPWFPGPMPADLAARVAVLMAAGFG